VAVRVVETSLHQFTLRTRLPFRYGITTLTECPHLLCRVTLEVDGRPVKGIAADNLPPKWFTKDPNQSFDNELAQMHAAIRSACGFAEQAGSAATVFDLWQQIDAEQSRWARNQKLPPLLSGFGTSLVERAMIEAFCRATGTTFGDALRQRQAWCSASTRCTRNSRRFNRRTCCHPRHSVPSLPAIPSACLDALTDDEIASTRSRRPTALRTVASTAAVRA
jgi:hypothetical protein